MNNPVLRQFRCPDDMAAYDIAGDRPPRPGYFRAGATTVAFARCAGLDARETPGADLPDALAAIRVRDGRLTLPFDPAEAADNLRAEHYVEGWRDALPMSALARAYYLVRPALPVAIRRHLQKFHLRAREDSTFPRWPVDASVDDMLATVLRLSMRARGLAEVPFIWFWPEGAPAAAFMTHDVETAAGRDFCGELMDIDDAFGIKSSFEVIPEQRYVVTAAFLDSIRARGFEVAVHDLNHDGQLYGDRERFLERAAKINAYGAQFGAEGFRGAVLYRKQIWFDALEFAYDMSVPNVATYDPQRGGCCAVTPYFLGRILELPVTLSQDYTLFNILGEYSTGLWRRQIDMLVAKSGLVTCISHPDYLKAPRAQAVYRDLLGHLDGLRRDIGLWIATPSSVNAWWRARDAMELVREGDGWRVAGACAERARVAWARDDGDRLSYRIDPEPAVAHAAARRAR